MTAHGAQLTIREAAEALGVSTRTVRRRIKEGELSATKEPHGKQEVWMIDGAELARYAQATGQTLTLTLDSPGQPLTTQDGDPGQRGAASPQVPTSDEGRQGGNGQATAAAMDSLRQEVERQRLTIAAVEGERDYLRERLTHTLEQVGNLTEAVTRLALPPHEDDEGAQGEAPARRSFWTWLLGRRGA